MTVEAVAEEVVLSKEHKLQIIDKLLFLVRPKRYKIAYGGRGGVKSWTFARVLLMLGVDRPLRILCAREVQKTLKDSVHKLLEDQIGLLGLEDFYDVQASEIIGKNGTSFIFAGLSDVTASSIKSFEGIDICWVEEAQTVTARSWNILTKTIRKAGSEIWVSFNPDLDTDETYVRFVAKPPPADECTVVHVTYRDNPWHTQEMEKERLRDQANLAKEMYDHIWEGTPSPAAAGAIFNQEVADMIIRGRVQNIPYDPRLKAHMVMDLGWNDLFAVGFFQRGLSDLRVVRYKEYQYMTPDKIAADMIAMRLNWGYVFLPWDGCITVRQTGKTDAQIFQSFGFKVKAIPNAVGAEANGIMALRFLFPRLYIDQGPEGMQLLERLRRWKRAVPKHGEPARPEHDVNSHGCRMMGYAAIMVDEMTNDTEGGPRLNAPQRRVVDAGLGALG